MEQVSDEIVGRIAAGVRAAPGPAQALLYAEREFFEWVERHAREWRLIYSEATRSGSFADKHTALRAARAAVFVELLNEAVEAAGLELPDPVEAEQVVAVLLGAGESLADWWLEHPEVAREVVAMRVATLGGHAVAELLGIAP
jgi:hypothetical protein